MIDLLILLAFVIYGVGSGFRYRANFSLVALAVGFASFGLWWRQWKASIRDKEEGP